MRIYIISLILLAGGNSQAQVSCLKEAEKIASGMGLIEKIEDKTPHVESYKEYSVVSDGEEQKESFSYEYGVGQFVIVMLPNYYGDGKCQFDKAFILRD